MHPTLCFVRIWRQRRRIKNPGLRLRNLRGKEDKSRPDFHGKILARQEELSGDAGAFRFLRRSGSSRIGCLKGGGEKHQKRSVIAYAERLHGLSKAICGL